MQEPDFKIVRFDRLDSTGEELKRRFKSGFAQQWTVITARTETSGKGRWGRSWSSPPGGLWFTVGLTLGKGEPSGRIRVLANVAAAEGIEALTGAPAAIRWPNDIILEGAKVGATNCETFWLRGATFVAQGFGINVMNPMPDSDQPITSLRQLGRQVDPEALMEAVLSGFAARVNDWSEQGWTEAIEAVRQRSSIQQGAMIEARMIDREISGAFAGFDDEANLLLCGPDGVIAPVAPDELIRVHFRPRPPADED